MLPSTDSSSAADKGNPMYPATPGGKALLASSAASSPDRPDARCALVSANSQGAGAHYYVGTRRQRPDGAAAEAHIRSGLAHRPVCRTPPPCAR